MINEFWSISIALKSLMFTAAKSGLTIVMKQVSALTLPMLRLQKFL